MASLEVLNLKNKTNLYDSIVNIPYIENMYYEVRLKTKHRSKIVNFETYYMSNIINIYETLKTKSYHHSNYNVFLVKEPKYRIIMSENIFDKVVNHLISEYILLPLIEPRLIPMNVATRRDKGLKLGLSYTKDYINHLKRKYDNFYILKCDIHKYFYSISHEKLIEKLRNILPDEEVIEVIKSILTSTYQNNTNSQIKRLVDREKEILRKANNPYMKKRFEELSTIPYYQEGRGLPIGNMTSQLFAIYYLNDLDHFIKEQLHIKYYIRYMDDFILMHPDREYLKYCLEEIRKKVVTEELKLNQKTKIISMKDGLNFLGYRFVLKNKKLLVLINSQTKRRITHKLNKLEKNPKENYTSVLASYKGYLSNCCSGSFIRKHPWFKGMDMKVKKKKDEVIVIYD